MTAGVFCWPRLVTGSGGEMCPDLLSLISAGMLLVCSRLVYATAVFRDHRLGIGAYCPISPRWLLNSSNNRRRDFMWADTGGMAAGAIITGFLPRGRCPGLLALCLPGRRHGVFGDAGCRLFYLPESLFFRRQAARDAGGKIKALLKRLGHDGAELPPAGGTVGAKASVRELFSGLQPVNHIAVAGDLLWVYNAV